LGVFNFAIEKFYISQVFNFVIFGVWFFFPEGVKAWKRVWYKILQVFNFAIYTQKRENHEIKYPQNFIPLWYCTCNSYERAITRVVITTHAVCHTHTQFFHRLTTTHASNDKQASWLSKDEEIRTL